MAKMSKAMLRWRAEQKRGKIMKPSTFDQIVREAEKKGATNPKAVAGAAYWRAARRKYAKRRK